MSLPPTSKDISTHPAKGSVVDPVNQQKKEKDVSRKVTVAVVIFQQISEFSFPFFSS